MSREESKVRYGVIGVGLMGIEHIRNLLAISGTIVTCIADDYPDSLDACMQTLQEHCPNTARDVKTFPLSIDLFKSNLCDVAIVATPNHTHHAVLMEAYRYASPDMHILVEKPLCTTISDCKEVTAAAKMRPGITYVGLEYSYMPPIARIISDSKKGIIGSPRMVAIREHRFPFLKKVRNWNRFSKNSGGTFVEKCCHFFDLFNRILSPQVPVRVFASGAQDLNHLAEVYAGVKSDILDNGYVIVEYSGGSRANLDLCMFAEASHCQEEVCIVGTKGKLEAFLPQLEIRTGIREKHSCGKVTVETADDERIKYYGHHHGSSYLEHLDILAAVLAFRKGEKLGISTSGLRNGILSVAVGVAAHTSIDERRSVSIDEILEPEYLASV